MRNWFLQISSITDGQGNLSALQKITEKVNSIWKKKNPSITSQIMSKVKVKFLKRLKNEREMLITSSINEQWNHNKNVLKKLANGETMLIKCVEAVLSWLIQLQDSGSDYFFKSFHGTNKLQKSTLSHWDTDTQCGSDTQSAWWKTTGPHTVLCDSRLNINTTTHIYTVIYRILFQCSNTLHSCNIILTTSELPIVWLLLPVGFLTFPSQSFPVSSLLSTGKDFLNCYDKSAR